MPPPLSAGVLLFRSRDAQTEVLLVKPGGPFWRNRDAGAWMIPKGKVEPGETPAEAALREFEEETGTRLTADPLPAWPSVRQAGGKMGRGLRASEGDLDADEVISSIISRWNGRREAGAPELPGIEQARWMTMSRGACD